MQAVRVDHAYGTFYICYDAVTVDLQFDVHPDYLTFLNSETYSVIPTSTTYSPRIDVLNLYFPIGSSHQEYVYVRIRISAFFYLSKINMHAISSSNSMTTKRLLTQHNNSP